MNTTARSTLILVQILAISLVAHGQGVAGSVTYDGYGSLRFDQMAEMPVYCEVRPRATWHMETDTSGEYLAGAMWSAKAEVIRGDGIAQGTIVTMQFGPEPRFSPRDPRHHIVEPMPLDTNKTYLLWGKEYTGEPDSSGRLQWRLRPEDRPVIGVFALVEGVEYRPTEGAEGTYEKTLNRLTFIITQASDEQRRVFADAMDTGTWDNNDHPNRSWTRKPSDKWTHEESLAWMSANWYPAYSAAVASSPPELRVKLLFWPLSWEIPEVAPDYVEALYQARFAITSFNWISGGLRYNQVSYINKGYFDQVKLKEVALDGVSADVRRSALNHIGAVDDDFRRALLSASIGVEEDLKRAMFIKLTHGLPRDVAPPSVEWNRVGSEGQGNTVWGVTNEAAIRAWWRARLGG